MNDDGRKRKLANLMMRMCVCVCVQIWMFSLSFLQVPNRQVLTKPAGP